jgi:hypothetical protein
VTPARAQTAAGEITGRVKDQAGAAVPGATITVIDIRTNRQRVVVSTRDGVYTAALNISGIPSNGKFPNTLPTFAPSGYQQIGSPMNTASDFSTSVTQIADSVTWLEGRHTMKMGIDWRWERLNVIQPPWPTGSFAFTTVGSDLPGSRTPATRSRVFCSDRCRPSSLTFKRRLFRSARTSRSTSFRTTGEYPSA